MTGFCSAVHTPALLHTCYHKTAIENIKSRAFCRQGQLQYAHHGRIPSQVITQRQQKLSPMEGGKALYVNPFYMSV